MKNAASDVLANLYLSEKKMLVFSCGSQLSFTATFNIPRREMIVQWPGESGLRILPQVMAASGTKYDDGTLMIWSKGERAMVDMAGGTQYSDCHILR